MELRNTNTGINPGKDMENAGHCINDYFGWPSQGDPLDMRRHINIHIAYNKQPIHYYNRENILKFLLIIDADAIDHNLLMMIVTSQSAIRGRHTMCQAGAILGTSDHMLVNTGATHNFININFARIIGITEQRINTSVLHRQAPSIITMLLALSAIMQAARQQATPPRSPSPLPLPCYNMSQLT
jgi:hypothetical protein